MSAIERRVLMFSLAILACLGCARDSSAAPAPSRLWPGFEKAMDAGRLPAYLVAALRQRADAALRTPPAPVAQLVSSGKTDKNDPALKATRRAFQDADNAALLALMARLEGDAAHAAHAKRILLAWATTHQPTGHPINETRLDGLLIACDLLRGHFTDTEWAALEHWLRMLRAKKDAWTYGPKTTRNNYRTHQLKMLLMTDRLLGDEDAEKRHTAQAVDHARVNIDMTTGQTVDYQERDALYYHVYDLEAWLDIALLTGRFKDEAKAAFGFLAGRIASGDLGGEFEKSTAPIDRMRAEAGHGYSKAGSTFDLKRASRVIVAYYTLFPQSVDPRLLKIATDEPRARDLFHLARQALCSKPKT